ncbi:MAG: CorA family divalent cation transporter [Candidatus Calescibacterium sp.]|nr:hypothetical protein [Candidatus Calescibacterium sp.]MDW8195804.1 CorA family divalent cation transporter [Candidatus Calescibacterium sp.]
MKKLATKSIKLLYKRKNKIGKLPQNVIQQESQEKIQGKIEIFKFNSKESQATIISDLQNLQKFEDELKTITSEYNYIINIDTNSNNTIPKIIRKYLLNFDEFIIEDVLNTDQRIKYETRKDLFFIIIKTPIEYDIKKIEESQIPKIYEQFSIILHKNLIIIFQEGLQGDILDPLRKNINHIKHNNIDFFIYYLIDLSVDRYLAFMEDIEDYLKELEKKIFSKENIEIETIYFIRTNLGVIKRDFLNLLEVVKGLKVSLFKEEIKYHIQDLLDHIYKTIEMVDNLNDFISYLLETYLSILNVRFNESVRILTVINTIFVPAIFIASIYGMNFENMPELKWKYGYFFTLFVIFSAIITGLIYFKYKKYI